MITDQAMMAVPAAIEKQNTEPGAVGGVLNQEFELNKSKYNDLLMIKKC